MDFLSIATNDSKDRSRAIFIHFDYVPFWFWRVINEQLYRPLYRPTDEEVLAVINHIKRNGGLA